MSLLQRLAFITTLVVAASVASGCMNPRPHRVRVGKGTCATCHMNAYLDAGVPREAGVPDGGVACTMSHTSPYWFPTDCAFCHVDTNWCDVPIGRVVDNHAPAFELSGPHLPTSVTSPSTLEQCVSCHLAPPSDPTRPDWLNRPRDCAGCHADDRDRANAKFCNDHPSFVQQLPCASCHRASGWSPAVRGLHPNALFPTSGGSPHAGIACQDCHDLDRLPTDAGLLANCESGAGAFVLPTPNYANCNQHVTNCPDCTCVGCHSVSYHRGQHEDRLTAYDNCTASGRPSHCENCHYMGTKEPN